MPFNEQLPEWHAVGVEPPASMKNEGWQAGNKPPADYWNWQMNRTYKALQELQQKAAEKTEVQQAQATANNAATAAAGAQATANSHASRHAAGGPDEITPEMIGAETPAGAQAKANTARTDAVNFTLAKFGAVSADSTFTEDWNNWTTPGVASKLLRGTSPNGPGSNEYFHVLNLEYGPTRDGSGQITQIAIPYAASSTIVGHALYIRGRYSGVWTAWQKFWHSGNDGHGSGMDADMVDGKEASGTLKTNEKNNLVQAINELFDRGAVFSSHRVYERAYSVTTAAPATLLDKDGNAFSASKTYVVIGTTVSTGTTTGAIAVFRGASGGQFTLVKVREYGKTSNHPEFYLDGNVPKIRLYGHSTNYSVNVITIEYPNFSFAPLELEVADLKSYVSNGKIQVRDAITGKGGTVADGDGDGIPTFAELAAGVNSISSSVKLTDNADYTSIDSNFAYRGFDKYNHAGTLISTANVTTPSGYILSTYNRHGLFFLKTNTSTGAFIIKNENDTILYNINAPSSFVAYNSLSGFNGSRIAYVTRVNLSGTYYTSFADVNLAGTLLGHTYGGAENNSNKFINPNDTFLFWKSSFEEGYYNYVTVSRSAGSFPQYNIGATNGFQVAYL